MTGRTLYDSFTDTVGRHGRDLAVRDSRQAWSYERLEAEAHDMASQLRKRGAQPGAVVPLVVRNTAETLALILGVLRTGAAYAPIDRRTPPARVRQITSRCNANIALDGEPVTHRSPHQFAPVTDQTTLAYVMFTSGSTGEPKGVMVTHEAVLHYLHWAMAEYEIGDGIGAPLLSSLAFDLSITSLFGPLLHGRLVDFLDDDRWLLSFLNQPSSFAAYSFMKATPSHLSLMYRALHPEEITVPLRAIIVGGEALYGESVRRWRAIFPESRFVNEYGPTEATVGCARYWVPSRCPPGPVPIGTAAPGTVLTVRDDRGDRTSGVGELYISGRQLAAGYLGEPSLTARTFRTMHDTLATEYRTGDLVAPAADGNGYVFLGRTDDQAKVNGHRVDLQEIDSTIRRIPGVADAAVVIADRGGADTVIAFLTIDSHNPGITSEAMRVAVAALLPLHMVPSDIYVVKDLPLNGNGKVDRLQLKERYLKMTRG